MLLQNEQDAELQLLTMKSSIVAGSRSSSILSVGRASPSSVMLDATTMIEAPRDKSTPQQQEMIGDEDDDESIVLETLTKFSTSRRNLFDDSSTSFSVLSVTAAMETVVVSEERDTKMKDEEEDSSEFLPASSGQKHSEQHFATPLILLSRKSTAKTSHRTSSPCTFEPLHSHSIRLIQDVPPVSEKGVTTQDHQLDTKKQRILDDYERLLHETKLDKRPILASQAFVTKPKSYQAFFQRRQSGLLNLLQQPPQQRA